MSDLTPEDNERDQDLAQRYRHASALDQSRPGEQVRRAILEHAAQVAAQVAVQHRRRGWRWWPAAAGTVAAAVLAGLALVPQWQPRPKIAQSPAAAPAATVTPAAGLAEPQPRTPAADTYSPQTVAAPNSEKQPQMAPRGAPIARGNGPQPVPAPAASPSSEPPTANSTLPAAPSPPAPPEEVTVTGARIKAAPPAPVPLLRIAPAPGATPDAGAALHKAAAAGDLPTLQSLLAASPGDIDSRDSAGRTAVMLATLNGRGDVVQLLLQHGADPNAPDAQGLTPLQAATRGNQPAIAQALQQAGAR